MMFLFTRSVLAVLLALIGFAAPLLAQSLQPSKTGLPGRTVWALTTSATGSGAARQTFTFAATDKGLWKSADNGGVWTEVPALKNQEVYAIKARRVGTTTTLLAATKKGILRSQDGGTLWASPEVTTGTVVSTSNILELKKVFDIEIVNSTWYAATEKGVFRSTNDGRSWTLLNIDRSVDNNEVRGITAEGSTIIVNLWREGLWRSTNNGGSWAKLSITGETSLAKTVSIVNGTTRVQQQNRATTASVVMIFVGAVSGNLWRSQDNGSTWTKILAAGAATRATSNVPTGIDAMTSIGTRIIGGTPNGLALSDDYGASWNLVQTSIAQPVSILAHEDKRNITVGIEQTAQTTAVEKNTTNMAGTAPGAATFTVASNTTQACPIDVTGFTPASLPIGSPTTNIIINGQNFPSSNSTWFNIIVYDEATNLVQASVGVRYDAASAGFQVTYQSPTSVALTVPSTWMAQASRIGVTVDRFGLCPTQGAGSTFYVRNPVAPTLTSLTPNRAEWQGTPLTVNFTANGANFTSTSVIQINGADVPTTRTGIPTGLSTSFTATAAGRYLVRIKTPGSPELFSARTDTLNVVNSSPSIVNISPRPPLVLGELPTALQLTGQAYLSGITAALAGTALTVPGTISSSQFLTVGLPQTVIDRLHTLGAGYHPLVLANPEPTQSGPYRESVLVVNPRPQAAGIQPFSVTRTTPQQTVNIRVFARVSGTGVPSYFASNATISFRGTTITPTSRTPVELTATIPVNLLDAAGTFPLTVNNPAFLGQGGGTSDPINWFINNPKPVANAVNPKYITAHRNGTVVVNGSSFLDGAFIRFRGADFPGTVGGSGAAQTLTASITAASLDSVGVFPLEIINNNNGGTADNKPLLGVAPEAPVLNSISQTLYTLGTSGQPFTMRLYGAEFVQNSRVMFRHPALNGGVAQALSTTYINAGELSAQIPVAFLNVAGAAALSVVTDGLPAVSVGVPGTVLGGGTSLERTLTLVSPQPSIQTFSPTTALRFTASAQTLNFTGQNFLAGMRLLVSMNGVWIDTLTLTSVSNAVPTANTAQAQLPTSWLDTAGTLSVRLLNPAPTAAPSSPVYLTVQNPRPRLSSLSVTTTLAGASSLTLTANGADFTDGVQAYANGASCITTRLSPIQASVTLPASVLAQAGLVRLALKNPDPQATPPFSDTLLITVENPIARLDSIAPAVVAVSTVATSVILHGINFLTVSEAADVTQMPAPVALTGVTYLSATQLRATLPPSLLGNTGTRSLSVRNPLTSVTMPAQATYTVVNPAPRADRLSPNVLVQSLSDLSLIITGDRFVAGAEVLLNGQTVTVSENTPTRLTVSIPANRIAERGQYSVVVRNPQTTTVSGTPDGGTSALLTLTVTTPQALVSGINLTQVPLDTVDVPLVITGSRFLDSAVVRITAPNNVTVSIATTSISANTINALIPASVLNRGGVYSVTVQNPAPTEAVSTSFTFAVVNPAPVVDSIAPRSVQPSTSVLNPTITVFGKLFTPTSVVRWRGADLPTTFIGRTRLTASIPAALQTQGGVGAVTVFTPTDGVTFMGNEVGGGTGSVAGALGTLLVSHAVPSLTSLVQSTVVRDAWATQALPTLSMTGELFASNATVRLLSADSTVNTNIPFASHTPTSLAVQLPRSLMAKTGVVRVRVQNQAALTGMFSAWLSVPDGGLSEERFFTMVNPAPTLTNLTPASVAVAAPGNLALSLAGTNFIPESVLLVNGRVWTRTVQSAVSMTASLPDSLFTLSGYVNVRVVNPAPVVSGGAADSSNVLQLEIFNPTPTLTAVAPVFTTIQGRTPADSVTITLTGANFVRNSVARLALTTAGSPTKEVPTTFRSRDTLLVRLLAADWTAAPYNMTVLNPAPRGGTSVARRFTVTAPAPVLTALLPASTTATGKAWTLTLTGRFFTAVSQVSYRNTLQSLTNTAYLPGTSGNTDTLRVKLAAVPVGDTTFPVAVYNPPTGGLGGGVSDTLRLAVGLPVPQITTLSPASTTSTLGVKERRGVLVVNGSLFDDAAKVFIQGQPVLTEFVSTTRLRAYLPDSLLANQARRTVQVRNTPVLVSNIVNFTVQNPTPVLTNLSPGTITAGRDTVLVLTGDKFAPDATVSLIYGSTVTPLTVLRRDSVQSVQVRVPDTLITRRGAYTVRVNNRPLALDTTNVGGGSDTYALTVIAAPIARVEVSGTDTLLSAGDRSAFITLRFRDPSGNLVDADPVNVNFAAAPDTSLPVALRPTPATGTFPVLRTSIGTYRLDTLRFYQAGNFTLVVDTSVTGAVPVFGPTRFVVRPLADASADMTGLRGTGSPFPAGDSLPSVTVILKDKFGNFTDNTTAKWSFVRTPGVPAGGHTFTSTATVRGVRLGTGWYRLEATQVVGAGLYTYSLEGAGTGFVYNGERTALVTPLTAVKTDFSNLRDSIVAGGRQSKVQVIFTDRYRNRTDVLLPEHRTLVFSNSGDTTTLPGEAFTQAEALTQRTVTSGMYAGSPVLGVYDASNAVVVPFAGRYRLAVPRIFTTTGTLSFVVVPAGDFFVTMTGVKDTITAGEELPAFTVSYRDRFLNPTDNAIGRVFYMHPSGSSTATLPMTRLDEGEYRVSSTVATLAGTYSVNVRNVDARNISGNRRFVVRGATAVAATFTTATTAMSNKGSTVTLNVTYTDVYGNLADRFTSWQFRNDEFASTGTITLTRTPNTTVGKFTAKFTVFAPGEYTLLTEDVPNLPSLNVERPWNPDDIPDIRDFECEPGPALLARYENVVEDIHAGETQPFRITFLDRRNAPTAWVPAETEVLFTGAAFGRVPGTIVGQNDYGVSTVLADYGRFIPSTTAVTRYNTTGNYTYEITTIPANNTRLLRKFTVNGATPVRAYIEFQNSTNALVAGASPRLNIRYFDAFGNLTPSANTVLLVRSSTNNSITVVTTQTTTAYTGIYTAQLRTFTTAGTYTFALQTTTATFAPPLLTGTTNMVIVPAQAQTAVFTNVVALQRTGTAPSFDVRYFDRYGNPTDNHIAERTIQARIGTTGGYPYTIPVLTNATLGVGRAVTDGVAPLFLTSGTYTLRALNDAGSSIGTVSLSVQTLTAVSFETHSLPTTTTAGTSLTNLQISFRDVIGNFIDFFGVLRYSVGSSTGTLALTRVSEGIYTIAPLSLTTATVYTFTVGTLSVIGTHPTVTVIPDVAASARIRNLRPLISFSDAQDMIEIDIVDRLGNPALLTAPITFATTTGTVSGIFTMNQIRAGVYRAAPITFVTVGTYSVTAGTLPLTGERTFFVVPPSITLSTVSLAMGSTNLNQATTQTIELSYRDLTTSTLTITPTGGFSISTNNGVSYSTDVQVITVQNLQAGTLPLRVRFTPTVIGAVTGTVTCSAGATQTTASLSVVGTGTTRYLTLFPPRFDFGNLTLGASTLASYIIRYSAIGSDAIVLNNGSNNIELSLDGGITFVGSNLFIVPAPGQAGEIPITLRITPSTSTSTMTIYTQFLHHENVQRGIPDPSKSVTANLTIAAAAILPAPRIVAVPDVIYFKDKAVNQTHTLSYKLVYSYLTTSTIAVNIRDTHYDWAGPAAQRFAISSDAGATYSQNLTINTPTPTGVADITVRFAPTEVGARLARIYHNSSSIAYVYGLATDPNCTTVAATQPSALRSTEFSAAAAPGPNPTEPNPTRNITLYLLDGVEKTSDGKAVRIADGAAIRSVLAQYNITDADITPYLPDFSGQNLWLDEGADNKVKLMDYSNMFIISTPDSVTAFALAAALQGRSDMLFAEQGARAIVSSDPPDLNPNDPYLNIGQVNAFYAVHGLNLMQMRKAWSLFTGDPNLAIGVFDTGVDSEHPDLKGKVQTTAKNYYPARASDAASHGTAIASAAAAIGDNCVGMAGIDWKAKIFSYNSLKITEALMDNATKNMFVLNHSYWIPNSGTSTLTADRAAFALGYKMNRVHCAAMGNFGQSSDQLTRTHYPAAFKGNGVVAVGGTNTTYDSKKSGFIYARVSASNFNSHIDIGAPSAFAIHALSLQDIATNGRRPDRLHVLEDPLYDVDLTGSTSVATALTSGVASLIKGYAKQEKSFELENNDVEQLLYLSVDKLPGEEDSIPITATTKQLFTYGTEWNQYIGHGRVNAYRAFRYIKEGSISHEMVSSTSAQVQSNVYSVEFRATPNVTDGAYSVRRYEVQSTPITLLSAKTHIWGRGAGKESWGVMTEDTLTNALGQTLSTNRKIQYGIGGCEIVPATRTATSVQLRTYIYRTEQDVTINGTTVPRGTWIPCAPNQVRFYYTLFATNATVLALAGKQSSGGVQNSISSENSNETPIPGRTHLLHSLQNIPLTLFPPFPNPASNRITFRYELTQAARVIVEVRNALGQTVEVSSEQYQTEGEFMYVCNTHNIPSGLYTVRVAATLPNGVKHYQFKQFSIVR